jgi:hypothetical protein
MLLGLLKPYSVLSVKSEAAVSAPPINTNSSSALCDLARIFLIILVGIV